MRRSLNPLHQMAIFMTMLTGGSCGMMYYFMQKNFSQAEYYRLALEQLNGHSTAMASLGAPPLKVYNLHLSDRYNRMDHTRAQIKIPVTGSKTGGYLFATSVRDPFKNRWHLEEVVLQLKEGERIEVFTPEPQKNN